MIGHIAARVTHPHNYGDVMDDGAGSPARILLARHGEAAYETDGSGDSGGSLTSAGREQARGLGRRLERVRPSMVVCSELSRAVQTAEIAASVLSLPVEVRVGLQEYDVGNERGRPYNAAVFEPLLPRWLSGDLSAGIPGGEDGHAVAQRMFAVLDGLAERAPGETAAVVSHGGAIIAVLGSIDPGSTALPRDANDMPGCDMYVLEKPGSRWQLAGRDRG